MALSILVVGILMVFFSLCWSEESRGQVKIISPQEGLEIISKKPELKVELEDSLKRESIVVLFDGTDVTQLIKFTEKGFEFKPFNIVPPGNHTLTITAKDREGNPIEKTISFKTKHTEAFDEAYSNNNATIIYQGILKRPEDFTNTPTSKLEGNLSSQTKLKSQVCFIR